MAFEKLANLDCETTTALGGINKKTGKKNPTSVEGYLVGSRDVPSPKSKTGLAKLHVFQTKDGNVGVWGKTNMDYQLKSVIPGVMTRVTFIGMKETKNNPMYSYSVEVDKDNTIVVANEDFGGVDSAPDAPYSTEDYADPTTSDSDPDGSALDDLPASTQVRASTPTANARARAEAILGKGRKSA